MKIETHPEAELGKALAVRVAADLRAALDAGTRASLAVPGGTTPAPFLEALSDQDLDWSNITVTLSDERCVPAESARSNAGLIARHLLRGQASQASFVPLYAEGQSVNAVESALAETVLPLHVCVLGMGGDMHTASLFPGTPGLAPLLDAESSALVALVDPPGADESRVTLTLAALSTARQTYLLIKGDDKRTALESAMETEDRTAAPIRAVLEAAREPVVFHAI